MLWLIFGVRKDSVPLILGFFFTHGVLFNSCFRRMLHLDITSGGKVGNMAKGRRDGGKGGEAAHRDDTADG